MKSDQQSFCKRSTHFFLNLLFHNLSLFHYSSWFKVLSRNEEWFYQIILNIVRKTISIETKWLWFWSVY